MLGGYTLARDVVLGDLREEKKGMTSAMTQATIHVATLTGVSMTCEWGCAGYRKSLTKNSRPCSPSDHGVIGLVVGVVEDAEEDETCRNRSVKNAQENDGRNHEREGNFLVRFLE